MLKSKPYTQSNEGTTKPAIGFGAPMTPELRSFFNAGFGQDFSAVRIHRDATAQHSAQNLGARAFTHGPHIAFAAGEYQPNTTSGRHLIAHELAHVVQQGASSPTSTSQNARVAKQVQCQSAPATSEKVWGFTVTRSMCGCQQVLRDEIAWTNTASNTYSACDVPANPNSGDIEACFQAAHPGSTAAATTSASGEITLPPASNDPCKRLVNRGIKVHEIMHSRHATSIARTQSPAFFAEWRRLAGDPDRLDKLRASFPAETAAFDAQWNNGHDWAQDEVNSFRWERRFYQSALAALGRLC